MDKISARSPKQLGHAFKRHRLAKKLVQTQLSEESGVRQAGISQLEGGHGGTRIETIFKIVTALDLEIVLRPRRKG